MAMKKLGYIIIGMAVMIGCGKEPLEQEPPAETPPPDMRYRELNNRVIRYGAPGLVLDADSDGSMDLYFGVQLIGDPIRKEDKRQWIVMSAYTSLLPVNPSEQMPVLAHGDRLPVEDFDGYGWYNASEIVLVERVEHASGAVRWQGNWKVAARNYLPFQVQRGNQRFNGWVELTADTALQQIVLHRVALSREAERGIRVGW